MDHSARLETLAGLSLELMYAQAVAPFSKILTKRVLELFKCKAVAFVIAKDGEGEIAHLEGSEKADDRRLRGALSQQLVEYSRAQEDETISCVRADETLGTPLAAELGWTKLALAKLSGLDGTLLGLICLADPLQDSESDLCFLEQLTRHAAAAVENLRSRIQVTHSSRQWAEIFDSITDFLLLHDERCRIVRVNRAFAESRRIHPVNLIGKSVRELFAHPQSSTIGDCPFCVSAGDSAQREEFIDPGTGRTYLISSSSLMGTVEEGRGAIHVLKDVTEHREMERLYRQLFDNLQEGAYFSTPEGRFIEVNNALVRMLGYVSQEELLAIDVPSLLHDCSNQRESLSRSLFRFGRLPTQEVILRRKDGSLLHALETGSAVFDNNGNICQFRGVVLDISEIKRVQAQLKREHDFNTQILNNTQSMILVVDTAGLVSYANRKCVEIMPARGEDLVGNRLETIIAPTHRRILSNVFATILEGHQLNNLQLPLVCGDEVLGKFSANFSPMRDEEGNVNSIVVLMTDVTDLAGLHAKLVQTEKMVAVGQMVSGVAHEVNNPLTAILGFADLLLENPNLDKGVREELEIIMQEAQRTREIIQNLLSFARQNPVRRGKVQINSILRRTVSLRAYDFNNKEIQLVQHLDESLPEVEGDAHRLQQVFLNILNNAYDAVCETGRRSRITVQTARLDEMVEVRFRDDGPGIKNIERIFDPFFTTKEVGKGTGLGLSICYGIMREHGGEITCFNNEDGRGATFLVRIPTHTTAMTVAEGVGI